MKFELDAEQIEKVNQWLSERCHELALEQLKNPELAKFVFESDTGQLYPYLGAIGGGVTYQFSPSSIGTFVSVIWLKGHSKEQTLDLIDYF